jgi:ubiquinone/menaquinone biosynthesis C-methylase UbiE
MYSPKDYWTNLAKSYDKVDASALAPILHPQAPVWFNHAIDNLQFRALKHALSIAEISPGSRILDVGCGTGRWVRRFGELGFCPTGVDATFGMLSIARSHRTTAPLVVGLASSLPFSDATFDGVSDITVVQHIPYELQLKALQEMVRVLRPGGRMILLELIRGKGSHIFPRPPLGWIREAESCGTNLINCFGHEFFLPDRVFTTLAQAFSGRSSREVDPIQSSQPCRCSDERSVSHRIYWQLRRVTVPFSAWTEPLVAKICPPSMATHAIFVFRKKL